MKLEEAVNICLLNAGHGSINELDDADDKNAHAQGTIKRARRRILQNGYEINTDKVDLQVDSNSRIPVSASYLKIWLPRDLSVRYLDGTRYVWDTEDSEWHDEVLTDTEVVFDIETFTEMPDVVAMWVAWESACDYYHEAHQKEPPDWLKVRMIEARAGALNHLQMPNLHDATGWSVVAASPGSRAAVNIDGHWVFL